MTPRCTPPPASHPLDLLPLFRRWPRSPGRDIVYTAIWSTMIGLLLACVQRLFAPSGQGFSDQLLPTLVIANLVGYLIHGSMTALDWMLRGWPTRLSGPARVAYRLLAVSLCVIAGVAIGNALLQGHTALHYLTRFDALSALLPFALAMAVAMFLVHGAGERRAQAALIELRRREALAAAAQLLAEARLRALQAQIEPHFLYNTLANVLSLIGTQPATAHHMLERFIDFLRASLCASRAERATVGAELDLATAYLDVLAVRMGARLRYRIDADAAARAIVMAPMLLQPLVENAVIHGLEPKIDGGQIVLTVRLEHATLHIEVADDGAGIGNASPAPRHAGGVGLSNLKARLRSVYGAAAQLHLLDNPTGGALVRLQLPLAMEATSTLPPP